MNASNIDDGRVAVQYCPVPGFLGYQVGDDGSVWSCWTHNGRNPRRMGTAWKRLRSQRDHDGYLAVGLYIGGHRHRRKVHVLVLEAFVGPRPAEMEGCHDNGNPADCSLSNLRWDTATANQHDRVRHGTSSRGRRNGNARLTETAVLDVRRRLSRGEQQADIARALGVAASTISGIKSGRLWGWLGRGTENG